MFNRTNQVQTININEWVEKLLAARDDVSAVERIRRELDKELAEYMEIREEDLKRRTNLYDFYFDAMPCLGNFEKFTMQTIDYQMPDHLVERWQKVCAEYQRVKSEASQA